MAKNLIPEIAQMLGVELGEKFKIKGEDELMTYSFNSDGLQVTYGDGIELPYISTNLVLAVLVTGEKEIIKLSWKPKEGEDYYSFSCYHKWCIWQQQWSNHPFDLALLEKGWVYRTRAEAAAALPKVAAEFGVEYEL